MHITLGVFETRIANFSFLEKLKWRSAQWERTETPGRRGGRSPRCMPPSTDAFVMRTLQRWVMAGGQRWAEWGLQGSCQEAAEQVSSLCGRIWVVPSVESCDVHTHRPMGISPNAGMDWESPSAGVNSPFLASMIHSSYMLCCHGKKLGRKLLRFYASFGNFY